MSHPMLEKAQFGLEAVARLRSAQEDNRKFTDAAANRLYFALYYACWAFLAGKGVQFDDTRKNHYNYTHGGVLHNLRAFPEFGEVAGTTWRHSLRRAQELRVKADYKLDHVEEPEIAYAAQVVGATVKKIIGSLQAPQGKENL